MLEFSNPNRKAVWSLIGIIIALVIILLSWFFFRPSFGELAARIEVRPDPEGRVVGKSIVCIALPEGKTDLSKVNEFKWEMGDGTIKTGQTVRYVYTSAGDYSVKLTIDGKKQYENRITILPATGIESPPETPTSKPMITAPDVGYINEPIIFSETSNTGSVWRWDMGDGQIINSAKTISYKYKTTGRRTIRVYINGDNSQYGEHSIVIRDKTPPHPVGPPSHKPRITKDQFKSMIGQCASKSISPSDFEQYLNPNGGFGINSDISLDGGQVVFSSYLRGVRITGKADVRTLELKYDNEGYIKSINIKTD